MQIEIKSRIGTVLFTATVAAASLYPIRDALVLAAASRANLSGANLSGANLSGANLSRANLSGADLSRADLYGADLYGANLYGADLYGANLSRADLYGANLYGANLSGANLYGANLSGANLYGANNLDEAKLPAFQISQDCALVVYKKLKGGYVAKLQIPAKAKRTASRIGRKCRAEYVKVLAIYPAYEGGPTPTGAFDQHHRTTWYEVGKTVTPDSYDPSPWVECTNGIHFFVTREEAEAY